MDSSLRMIRVMGVVGMVTILGALGGATRRAPVQARGILPRTACAALGAYQIGARIVPERAGTHPGVSSGTARPGRATTAIVSRPWLLRGTLTLSGYSGCGQPTAGIFSIQRSVVGPPIERPRGQGATMMCPQWVRPAHGGHILDPAQRRRAAHRAAAWPRGDDDVSSGGVVRVPRHRGHQRHRQLHAGCGAR